MKLLSIIMIVALSMLSCATSEKSRTKQNDQAMNILFTAMNSSFSMQKRLRPYHKYDALRQLRRFNHNPIYSRLLRTVRSADTKKEFEYIFSHADKKISSGTLRFYRTGELLPDHGFNVFIHTFKTNAPTSAGYLDMVVVSDSFLLRYNANDAVLLSSLMRALTYYRYATEHLILNYNYNGKNMADAIIATTTAANVQRLMMDLCFPKYSGNDPYTAFLLKSAREDSLNSYAFSMLGIELSLTYNLIRTARDAGSIPEILNVFYTGRALCETSLRKLIANRNAERNTWEYYDRIVEARTLILVSPWTTWLVCTRYDEKSGNNPLTRALSEMTLAYQNLTKEYLSGNHESSFVHRLNRGIQEKLLTY